MFHVSIDIVKGSDNIRKVRDRLLVGTGHICLFTNHRGKLGLGAPNNQIYIQIVKKINNHEIT